MAYTVTPRIKRITKEQVAQALEFQSEGFSVEEIGELWGVARKTAENILGRARRFGFEVFERAVYLEV